MPLGIVCHLIVYAMLSCLGSFPALLFYDEFGKCLKLGVHTELLENEFISLKEYEEQFGKYLKLGVKNFGSW